MEDLEGALSLLTGDLIGALSLFKEDLEAHSLLKGEPEGALAEP